jgi:hypothetical protein
MFKRLGLILETIFNGLRESRLQFEPELIIRVPGLKSKICLLLGGGV